MKNKNQNTTHAYQKHHIESVATLNEFWEIHDPKGIRRYLQECFESRVSDPEFGKLPPLLRKEIAAKYHAIQVLVSLCKPGS